MIAHYGVIGVKTTEVMIKHKSGKYYSVFQ